MKILKKGNAFVAYRTEKGELGAGFAEAGSEIGRISITTGKFTGGTGAFVELSQKLREFLKPKEEKYEELVDAVIEDIKSDINNGDVTVLDELLRMIPTKNLIQSLAEERWSDFDSLKEFR